MTGYFKRLVTVILFTTLLCSPGMARTWTSVSGASLEAELVSEIFGSVKLKKPDGTVLQIRMSQLSAEDQQYIRKVQSGEISTETKPSSENAASQPKWTGGKNKGQKSFLPLLDHPEWSAFHAVIDKPEYRAVVNFRGDIIVFIKENGVELPVPFEFSMVRARYRPDGGGQKGRKLVSVSSSTAPSTQINEITLHFTFEKDVKVSATCSFEKDEICGVASMEDGSDVEYPSFLSFICKVPESMKFDKSVELEAQKTALEEYELDLERPKGQGDDETYEFWKSLPSHLGRAETATVVGPYGNRTLELESESTPSFVIWHYNGKPLSQGVSFVHHAKEKDGEVGFCLSIKN